MRGEPFVNGMCWLSHNNLACLTRWLLSVADRVTQNGRPKRSRSCGLIVVLMESFVGLLAHSLVARNTIQQYYDVAYSLSLSLFYYNKLNSYRVYTRLKAKANRTLLWDLQWVHSKSLSLSLSGVSDCLSFWLARGSIVINARVACLLWFGLLVVDYKL